MLGQGGGRLSGQGVQGAGGLVQVGGGLGLGEDDDDRAHVHVQTVAGCVAAEEREAAVLGRHHQTRVQQVT